LRRRWCSHCWSWVTLIKVLLLLLLRLLQGSVTDMREEKVVQPLLVTSSALTLATECVRMILKVGWLAGIFKCAIVRCV
jgi:hypothetical protein